MTHLHFPEVFFLEEDLTALKAFVLPYQKLVIIGGETAIEKSSELLTSAFQNQVIPRIIYGRECTKANIERLALNADIQAADLIVAVGGGKALDTVKAVANQLGTPVITIPSIAGTCAASTKVSVVYTDDHVAEAVLALDRAPEAVFISLDVLRQAPSQYLWAGIGDSLAKPVEVEFSLREKEKSLQERLALQIAQLCIDESVRYGELALKDNQAQRSSEAFKKVLFTVLVSTGYASNMVGADYTASLAHALYYALTAVEHIHTQHLHGEVVAYGVLVLLELDKQEALIEKLMKLYKGISLPYRLSQLELPQDKAFYANILAEAQNSRDLVYAAYPITADQIYDAMMKLEERMKGH